MSRVEEQRLPAIVSARRLLIAAVVIVALDPMPALSSPLPDDPLSRAPQTGAAPVAAGARPVSAGDRQTPAHLLQLPPGLEAALVIELESNRLHVFQRADPRGVDETGEAPAGPQSYYVAIGKNGGAKSREGDEKTPVGIYFVTSFLPAETLPAIYGAGALPINYPNTWDRRLGRTGGGIWIHGTDKESAELAPQSSRGCLTLADNDFLSLAQRVQLQRTPVIVSDRLSWESATELEARRQSIAAAVEAWRQDWESLDTDAYFAHYSPAFRSEGMDRERWVAHKRRVNAQKSFIRVELSEIGIYGYPGEPDHVLVTFHQDYRSSNYETGKWKQQFWRLEQRAWRIIHEGGW